MIPQPKSIEHKRVLRRNKELEKKIKAIEYHAAIGSAINDFEVLMKEIREFIRACFKIIGAEYGVFVKYYINGLQPGHLSSALPPLYQQTARNDKEGLKALYSFLKVFKKVNESRNQLVHGVHLLDYEGQNALSIHTKKQIDSICIHRIENIYNYGAFLFIMKKDLSIARKAVRKSKTIKVGLSACEEYEKNNLGTIQEQITPKKK